jgi:hypothetical protein
MRTSNDFIKKINAVSLKIKENFKKYGRYVKIYTFVKVLFNCYKITHIKDF